MLKKLTENQKTLLKSAAYLTLATILILLPIKMGEGANQDIPVLGYIENEAEEYYNNTLLKATGAYAIAKVVNKSIAVVSEIEVGIGVASLHPGKVLEAANDGIERVSSALFSIIGIILVQKLCLGMLSFIS